MSPAHWIITIACTLAVIFFIGAVRLGTSAERQIKRRAKERRLEFSESLINRRGDK